MSWVCCNAGTAWGAEARRLRYSLPNPGCADAAAGDRRGALAQYRWTMQECGSRASLRTQNEKTRTRSRHRCLQKLRHNCVAGMTVSGPARPCPLMDNRFGALAHAVSARRRHNWIKMVGCMERWTCRTNRLSDVAHPRVRPGARWQLIRHIEKRRPKRAVLTRSPSRSQPCRRKS